LPVQIGVDYAAEVPLDLTCRYTGSDVRVRDDGMPLAHVALAVEGSIIHAGFRIRIDLMWNRIRIRIQHFF
jgi:hypothetical protein